MSTLNLKSLSLIVLIALLVWPLCMNTCNARKERQWRPNKDTSTSLFGKKARGSSSPSLSMRHNYIESEDKAEKPGKSGGKSSVFNVLDYGAEGDGKADDTKAFQTAWKAACKVKASTIVIPTGSVFLVKPISLTGPCQSDIVFQLDGKIIAPTDSSSWGSGIQHWIEFKKVTEFTFKGKGIIDGQGSVWWNIESSTEESPNSSSQDLIESDRKKMPSTKPTALRFYGSVGVTVTGITIQNSQQFHLKFDDCNNVQVSNIEVSSPGDSPNTDGIHLQNTQNVHIYNANLACGDDCISIQTGSSNVYIHNVNCGPGHGISIGSLGKDNTKACVSNITVRNTKIQNAMNGVRIKTWQGGSGSVKNIMFSNIEVSEVKTPIIIDQFYCDKSKCKNQTSAVAVSGIHYENIQGTYSYQPVHFACSDSVPCTGVTLDTIKLKPAKETSNPFCWKAYGELKTSTVPPVDCLNTDKPSSSIAPSKVDSC